MVRIVVHRSTASDREGRWATIVGLMVGTDLFLNGAATYIAPRVTSAVWMVAAAAVGIAAAQLESVKARRERIGRS